MRFPSLLLACFAFGAQAAEVSVAVAANFTAPMREIAAGFEKATGHRAVLAFGSTGRFHAQIANGAPFDVLLAADDETPAKLARKGKAVEASRFTYATGRLVLWSAQPGVVDAQGEVLKKGGPGKIAIADPKLAPYGRAAMETLGSLGVLAQWQPRIVHGVSTAQALQFVATGNVPIGFVALSQVTVDGRIDKGSAWVVPAKLHQPIRQDAVILQRASSNDAALALVRYLRSDAAKAVIKSFGYEV